VKNAIRGFLSRPSTQPALLQLLKLCHAGLNYGGGQSVGDSGEIGALKFLHSTLGRSHPVTLFDVGANDGTYLQSALRVFGDRLRAYSFEPQSASFERLSAQFANDPRVQLRRAAVGKAAGTADLFFDGNEHETTASLHRNSLLGQGRKETVRLTTIDQVCDEDGIRHIDFLKIDTEGHEMEVLLGASGMMGRGISSIQFEFGDTFLHTTYHFFDLWELLSPGYRIYRILRHGLVEVPRYSPDLEIYKVANFLCMRKT